MVRSSTKSLSGFTTTERPSQPTSISTNSMPLAAQLSCSELLIARDALEMSVSPAQKRLKPPPVPETPTCTRTFGATARNSSATASEMGKTVLDPSMPTSPERLLRSSSGSKAPVVDDVPCGLGVVEGSSLPQAATTRATTANSAASIADFLRKSVRAEKLRSFILNPPFRSFAPSFTIDAAMVGPAR